MSRRLAFFTVDSSALAGAPWLRRWQQRWSEWSTWLADDEGFDLLDFDTVDVFGEPVAVWIHECRGGGGLRAEIMR